MSDDKTATPATTSTVRESALPLVEALLFASSKPVPPAKLAEAAELPIQEVEAALDEIEKACEAGERGVRLDRVAGGVRLVSRGEFDGSIRRLLGMEHLSCCLPHRRREKVCRS
jgi:chromosome segregation and condensation protein ScpB